MRRTAAVVVVALGALVLGACGDDDDSGGGGGGGDVSEEEQPYVEAIAAQFQSGEDDELQLTSEQADCVSPRWVSTIGVDRFEEHDVAPEDITDEGEDELTELGLDEGDGNELYDAFEDCDVDVPALLLESLNAEGDVPTDVLDCLSEEIDDDLVRELMVASITGGDEALTDDSEVGQEFNDALRSCAPQDG